MNYKTAVAIGSGGMGEVFKAWDPGLERFVAIKFLRSNDPVLVERLLREARAQARLDHPSICKIYEVGEDEGRPFIAMEFVDGKPLDVAVREMSVEQKVLLMAGVADAVQAAHSAGLIHRDLKPANILVREEEGEFRPYVLDFGIAQIEEAPGLTLTGQVIGTPGYISPEQARGDTTTLDRRTDIFSLGVILYEILSGSTPFSGTSSIEVMIDMLEGHPEMLRRRAPQIPGDLEAITMRCLEPDPEKRYPSARELADDLQRWLRGEAILTRRTGLLYSFRRAVRRHRFRAALIALALIFTIGGWAKYTVDLSRQQRLAQAAREDAEDLVAFMLEDLFGRLKPLGRLDVLDQVATKVASYYKRFSDEDLAPEQQLRRVRVLRNLADVIDAEGEFDSAYSTLQRAAAILESGEIGGPERFAETAVTHSMIAELLQEKGELEACIQHLNIGLKNIQPLVQEKPEEKEFRGILVEILINIAWAERELGHWDAALAPLRKARTVLDEQAELSAHDPGISFRIAEIESYTARVFQEAEDFEAAEHHLSQAQGLLEKLAADHAEDMKYQFELVLTSERLGSLAEARGMRSTAIGHYRRGIERGLRISRFDPANTRWQRELSVLYSSLGALLLEGGDARGAGRNFEAGLAISEGLVSRGRTSASATNDLAWDWLQLGLAREALKDTEAARQAFERSRLLMAPIVAETREVWYLDTWAMALLHLGRVDEARPAVEELLEAGWDEPDFLSVVEHYHLAPSPDHPGPES